MPGAFDTSEILAEIGGPATERSLEALTARRLYEAFPALREVDPVERSHWAEVPVTLRSPVFEFRAHIVPEPPVDRPTFPTAWERLLEEDGL